MRIKGEEFGVVGLGESGYWVSLFLKEKGARVWVTEIKKTPLMEERLESLRERGIEGELGKHTLERLEKCRYVILSPGINPEKSWVKNLREKGIPLLQELEVGLRFLASPYIMVTGTNGKSTTVELIKTLLGEGWETAGNTGYPLTRLLLEKREFSGVVLEVSSFQLKGMKDFSPQVSVILNIAPDHLDWHGSWEDYLRSKKKIFLYQDEEKFTLWNARERWWERITPRPRVYFFSPEEEKLRGCFCKRGWIVWREEKEEGVLPLTEWRFPGTHNLINLTASVGTGILMGVSFEDIRKRIKKFRPLPHRMEELGIFSGVRIINDSKATNVSATRAALNSLPPGIVLILGGRDKGNDYSPLFPLIKSKVRYILVLGESREKLRKTFSPLCNTLEVKNLREAVWRGRKLAIKGDILLLSPACSSLDEFANYRERGELFKKFVREIWGRPEQ